MSSTYLQYQRDEAATLLQRQGENADWIRLSRHGNGFLREAATRRLATWWPDADVLHALLERLNDWVPAVRDAARPAVENALRLEHLPAWLLSLPALLSLRHKQRVDHGPFLARVGTLLSRPEARPHVHRHWWHQRDAVAEYLFALLLEAAAPEQRDHIVTEGLRHASLRVRRNAIRATERLPAERARVLLEDATHDRNAGLRALALRRWLAQAEPSAASTPRMLERALLDPAAAPRDVARYHATAAGVDPHRVLAFALQATRSDKTHWQGMIGLAGQLKDAQALPRLEDAARHPSARLRRSALEAWNRISPDPALDRVLIDALEDPHSKTRKLAWTLLKTRPLQHCADLIDNLLDRQLEQGNHDDFRRIIALKPYWARIEYLLRRKPPDGHSATMQSRKHRTWIERLFHRTPPEDDNAPSVWQSLLFDTLRRNYDSYDTVSPAELKTAMRERLQRMEDAGMFPPDLRVRFLR